MDETFNRDLLNHWTRFGAAALVEKAGRKWLIRFRGYTFPATFATRKAAMDQAVSWVLASRRPSSTD